MRARLAFPRQTTAQLAALLLLLSSACGPFRGDPQNPGPAGCARQYIQAQLIELEALPRPEPVSAADWLSLKAALRSMLEARLSAAGPPRQARLAPAADGAATVLSFDDQSQTFYWSLHNPGDYDQNGEVNVADLTPLGLHFGESYTPGPPEANDSIQAVVDGDGNGEINLADLTPIGANFGRSISHYLLVASPDGTGYPEANDAPSVLSTLNSAALGEGSGDKAKVRLQYSCSGFGSPDKFFWVRPYDAASETYGTPSNLVDHMVSSPVARLSLSPASGPAPLNVSLDASHSENYGGGSLRYFWDPEGDGSFAEGAASLLHNYALAGVYHAALRVLDAHGGCGFTQAELAVGQAPAWHGAAVLTALPDTEIRSASAALYKGAPAVCSYLAFSGDTQGALVYASAFNNLGQSWTPLRLAYTSSGICGPLSASLAGPDRVFNLGATEFIVAYQSSADLFNGDWDSEPNFAFANDGFRALSLALIAGNPAMVLTRNNPSRLAYLAASDAGASAWEAEVMPVPGTSGGGGASLMELSGAPAIAWFDDINGQVMYIDSALSGGSLTWNTPRFVAFSSGAVMSDGLVRLADGSPAVVYHDQSSHFLCCVHAPDASGQGVWQMEILANTDGSAGLIPTALTIGGVVHVIFAQPGAGSLNHCYSLAPDASSWSVPDLVDAAADSSYPPDLLDAGGLPGVLYSRSDKTTLMFATYY